MQADNARHRHTVYRTRQLAFVKRGSRIGELGGGLVSGPHQLQFAILPLNHRIQYFARAIRD